MIKAIIWDIDGVIVDSENHNRKPDPEIFLKTAEKLNALPEECLVIEDSLNGIKAGKSAEMKVVAHKAHHNQDLDFSQADFIAEELRKVPRIIEGIDMVLS